MTTERREEQRRCQDAIDFAKYTLDRKNYIATINSQEEMINSKDDRIKALESLLARISDCMLLALDHGSDHDAIALIREIDAILPATEGKKDE